MPPRSTPAVFEKNIQAKVNVDKHKVVVVLLPRFTYYAPVKRCLDKLGIISQIVLKSNVRKG